MCTIAMQGARVHAARPMRASDAAYDAVLIGTSVAFACGVALHRRHVGWQLGLYAAFASVLFRATRLARGNSGLLMHTHPLFAHDVASAVIAIGCALAFAEPVAVRLWVVLGIVCFADAWRVTLGDGFEGRACGRASRLRHALGHLCAVAGAWA